MTTTAKPTAATVFNTFERLIQRTNTFPLVPTSVSVQQDAYHRLGGTDSADEPSWEPFAEFDFAKKERDTDLRFHLTFTEGGVLIGIEGWGSMGLAYDDLGNTATKAAHQLAATASMLSNGQLSVLHTLRGQRICCAELLFRKTPTASPVVLAVQANYPRFLHNDTPDDYETQLLRNTYDTPRYDLADTKLVRAHRQNGEPITIPRAFPSQTLTPLTRADYQALMSEVGNDLVGVQDNKEFERKLTSTPEYWFIALSCSALFYLLVLRQFKAPFMLAGIPGFAVSGYVTTRYLFYKQELLDSGKEYWWLQLSTLATRLFSLRHLYTACLAGVLFSTTLPIYVLKDSGKLANLYQLAQATQPAFVGIAAVFAVAIGLAFVRKKVAQIVGAGLALCGVGLLVVANALSNTSDTATTPELPTDFSLFAYILLVAFAIGLLVTLLRKPATQSKPKD